MLPIPVDLEQCSLNPEFAKLLRALAARFQGHDGIPQRLYDDFQEVLRCASSNLTHEARKSLKKKKLEFLECDLLIREIRELILSQRLAHSGDDFDKTVCILTYSLLTAGIRNA